MTDTTALPMPETPSMETTTGSPTGLPGLPGFNVLTDTRHGPMLVNRLDVYVGACLQAYGEYSPAERDLLIRLVPAGGIVIECGANIGALTIPLAQHLGRAGMVLAFEPQRLAFQLLCANVALNSLTNVAARQMAVGASRGRVLVPMLDPEASNNVGGFTVGAHGEGEPVPIAPLDDIVGELPRLDVIKADVEGMELAVVLGARKLIETYTPVLVLEADRPEKVQALVGALEMLGYTTLLRHLPRLAEVANYRGNPDQLFVNERGQPIVSINLLAFHASQPIPAWLATVPDLAKLEG